MRIATFTLAAMAAVAAACLAPVAAQAQPKTPGPGEELRIGNTVPYSGPLSSYGTIGQGIDAYFRMVNDNGGVNGRKIKFISLDDGYSPSKTVEATRQMVEQDGILLTVFSLGTTTNAAVQKYLNAKKVPQLFVATGGSRWANPKQFPWTMGWQPDYVTEAEIYARHIMQTIKEPKIGILYQNDDFGRDYLEGFHRVLGADAKKYIVMESSYETTDPTVDSQILQLKNSGANVFYNGGSPKFAAQAIRKAADVGWKPVQYLSTTSVNVSTVLTPAGLDNSVGIISGAYMKDPSDPHWANDPGLKTWRAWLDKYMPSANPYDINVVYAHSVGETLMAVLRQCGDDFSTENIMRQATNLKDVKLPMLVDGITVNTSPEDYKPIQGLQLQRFNGKSWALFGDVINADKLK